MKETILGIDLGTTNSLVSCIKDGRVEVIVNERGARLTPSVVSFSQGGQAIVGEIARNQAVLNNDVTIANCKRKIGSDHQFLIQGRHFSAIEVSALILRKLKISAAERLGHSVARAVITVPAHFNEKQRHHTIKAAEMAEIEVVRLLNEPTAAAIAYGLYHNEQANLLVIDIGGGTTDITLMNFNSGLFTVKGTSGSSRLGGVDLDLAVVDWLGDNFKQEHGIQLKDDPIAHQQLIIQAEQAKIDLSQTDMVEVFIPFISGTADGPLHLRQALSRKKLEELNSSFFDRLTQLITTTIDDQELDPDWVTDVVFVGGVTRMPRIKQIVQAVIPGRVMWNDLNPDEAPVLGAGALAGKFAGQNENFFIFKDITANELGIEDHYGKFVSLIKRGTIYPASATRLFTTTMDNQSDITIHLLQKTGDGEIISLGSFSMTDLPARPAGELPVDVTIKIDESGLIKVTALDLENGNEQCITERADQPWDNEGYARRGTGLEVV